LRKIVSDAVLRAKRMRVIPDGAYATIRDRTQDVALNSLSLRERVGVRGYRLIRRGH
jgi:hypothetical protein